MKVSYFWPVYGEQDEVCFPFHTSRRAEHVREILGLHHAPGSVLLTDGYAAYDSYVKKADLTHAQYWAHARRELFEAQDVDPAGAAEALTDRSLEFGSRTVREDCRGRNQLGRALRRMQSTAARRSAYPARAAD
jgi:hypothetical protein